MGNLSFRPWMIAAAFLLVGLACLLCLYVLSLHSKPPSTPADAAEARLVKTRKAAEDRCTVQMEKLDASARADADFRRGDSRPIVMFVGDDVSVALIPGIAMCKDPVIIGDFKRSPANDCPENLSGPHPAVIDYAARYNRRMAELAPRSITHACTVPN